ncbi:MAG TPA: cobalamin-dependent protein [Solirubrobacteraceae bacterium]
MTSSAPPPQRRLRALITVIGLDQHEAGALYVARLLRDAGIEVIYAGRFQVPETIAEAAEQEDVDVIGISAHSWEFLHYAEELVQRLSSADPPIPVVVGGSVITSADRTEVLSRGISEVVIGTASPDEIVSCFRTLGTRVVDNVPST